MDLRGILWMGLCLGLGAANLDTPVFADAATPAPAPVSAAKAACVLTQVRGLSAELENFGQRARAAIYDSPTGRKVLAALGVRNVTELDARLAKPEHQALKKQIDSRESRVVTELARLEKMDATNHIPDPERAKHFAQLAELMAGRYLEPVKTGFRDDDAEFFEPIPAEIVFPTRDPGARPLKDAQDKTDQVRGETKSWIKRMRDCVASTPQQKSAFTGRVLRNALVQLGVSETMTASSAVAVQGIDHLRARDLSAEMATTAVGAGLGTVLANGGGNFALRYFKVTLLSQALDLVELGIYALLPMKAGEHDLHRGASPTPSPVAQSPEYSRFAIMNAVYSAGDDVGIVGMNALVEGMECLNPGQKGVMFLTAGMRAAYSIGDNLLYFEVDKKVMNPNPKSSGNPVR